MLGGSFRSMARALVPLALLFILAACGSPAQKTRNVSIQVRGPGFAFDAPSGTAIGRPQSRVVAGPVSVSTFPLRKPYDPAQFETLAKTLDGVAARLARSAGTTITDARTLTIADRQARAYRYAGKRIAFVLAGRREYQLFCSRDGAACDLLLRSFTLTGPQA
jgi:hypothetical protein